MGIAGVVLWFIGVMSILTKFPLTLQVVDPGLQVPPSLRHGRLRRRCRQEDHAAQGSAGIATSLCK